MTPKILSISASVLVILGCTPQQAAAPPPTPVVQPTAPALPLDGCTARTAPVTVTTVVTEQVMVIPETTSPDGSITSPPVFRNQTRPVTQTVNDGITFATLCAEELTSERIATLQRALKARLAYDGPITGVYDAPTQAAVQAFQKPEGFDSPQLARSVAQRLGLVPLGAEATNAFQ